MTPVVDGIEQRYGGQVMVKRINAAVGEGPEIMRAYRLPGHPATLLFDEAGQEKQRWVGPQSAETIENLLSEVLAD